MLNRRQLCVSLPLTLAMTSHVALAEDKNSKQKGGGITYLQFQTLTATVIKGTGRRGVLTVEAGLDIPNPTLRSRALLDVPRLRAAYVQRLQIYAGGLAPEAPPDSDYLSRAMQTDTDRVLGQPGARFLLGAILVN